MQIQKTALPGVVILTPQRFGDGRGWFSETWSATRMAEVGLDLDFVQDNHSYSAQIGTLRGLHFQSPPRAQDKLVRCTRGAIRDAAVDARRGSPTYGHWITVDLTPENGQQLLVPKGFLHGFITLTADTEVQYKCTDTYAPAHDGGVRWDSVGIDWGVTAPPVLSGKDTSAPAFADWESPFVWEGAE
jgi:dTDP-4-dehydrorhamnose 3,5-epimerase